MTSTTRLPKSKKSKLDNVLKMNFRRYLPGFLTVLCSCVAVAIAAVLIEYGYALRDTYAAFSVFDVTSAYKTVFGIVFFFVLLYDLIAPTHYFSEIYSKRACDSYFSAPIKRADRFNAAFIMGVVVNVAAPILASLIVSAIKIAGASGKFAFSCNFKLVCIYTLFSVAALLAFWSAFMLCAVMAGKLVQYLVLCGISSLFVLIGAVGVASRLNLVWGIMADYESFTSVSPIGAFVNILNSGGTNYKSFLICIPVSFAAAVLLYFAGLTVFKKRPAETAEGGICGKVMPYLLLALFAFGGFVFFEAADNFIVTAVAGIITAAINGLAFCVIFFKKAYTKHGAVCVAVTVAAGIALLLFSYFPPEKSFVAAVPSADSVESAQLEVEQFSYGNAIPLADYLSTSLYVGYSESEGVYKITEPENIEKLIALHQKTVSADARQKTEAYYKNLESNVIDYDSMNDDLTAYNESVLNYTIRYTLKNGKKITRKYNVAYSAVIDEYVAAVQNEEVLNQTSLGEDSFKNIYYSYFNNYDYGEMTYDSEGEYSTSYDSAFSNSLTEQQILELRELLIADRISESKNDFLITESELFSEMNWYYRGSVNAAVYGDIMNYSILPELSDKKRAELEAVDFSKRGDVVKRYDAGGYTDESGVSLFEMHAQAYQILESDKKAAAYIDSLGYGK